MATVVKGGTAYSGVSGTITTHTDEDFSTKFAEAVFNSTPVLKALGSRKWNGENDVYGNMRSGSRKAIRFFNGFQFSGRLATSAPSAEVLTKGGTVSASTRDDWTGWAYDDFRIFVPLQIPEVDIQDNAGKARLASLVADEMRLGMMSMARDVERTFLGHSSAPSGIGNVGLPYMVSVTQTGSIGGISRTNDYWQNFHKEISYVGGGGDTDRPVQLVRGIRGALTATSRYATSAATDLQITNEGGWCTLHRAADWMDGLVDTTKRDRAMYNFGIAHILLGGQPLVFSADATSAWGDSTSGDFIYGLSTDTCGLAFKAQEYFRKEDWLPPNARSTQRASRANIFCRFTPYITDRRTCYYLYGWDANTEATSD